MSKQKKRPDSKDHHGHDHHNTGHDGAKNKKMIAQDWRFWTAIVLMVLAMPAYVSSFDGAERRGRTRSADGDRMSCNSYNPTILSPGTVRDRSRPIACFCVTCW